MVISTSPLRKPVARGGRASRFRAPYHNWNDCITAGCYAPNAGARILDNDERISFNFGPTLLA